MFKNTMLAALAATTMLVAAPAMAAQIADGGLTFAVPRPSGPTLAVAPDMSSVNFNNLTFDFVGTGGFLGADSGQGRLNGLVNFVLSVGDTQTYPMNDLFVFDDGEGTKFHFSADSVTTQTYSTSGSTAFSLYFLGNTSDAALNLDPTATSMTLSFNQTGSSTWAVNGSLSVPPQGTTAVPEPASWAMMVGGFGLLGGALRRKRTNTAVTFG